MNKSHNAKAWLIGMNKFFRLHDYLENMKARISTFSLKGKADIWCGDVKNIRDIYEELTWSEFERLFRKQYLSKMYYYDKEK